MNCEPYASPTISSTSSSSLSYSISATPTHDYDEQRRPPSFKYKGVVPQPNGRWGAQLYYENKRIWIGTFDNQVIAAQAYDLVVIRFRGPHAITNFPIRNYSRLHLEFLASHSEGRVIDMIRNQTYEDEFARFSRAHLATNHARWMDRVGPMEDRERLFEKVLTPSDVGKLHRLVIPKHHAENHFPGISDVGGMMLSFEDSRRDKMWRFKYCYWKSSQNYVLTKGWGEFVKDKGLKAGDSVTFFTTLVGCERRFSIDTNCNKQIMQEVCHSGSNDDDGEVELLRSKILRLFGVDIICPSIPVEYLC